MRTHPRLRRVLTFALGAVLASVGAVAALAPSASASCPDQWCGAWGTISAGVNIRNAPWVGATILRRTTTADSVEVHCYYYGGTYGGSQFLINGTWYGIWDQIVDPAIGVSGFAADDFVATTSDIRTIAPACGAASPPVTPTGITAVALGSGRVQVTWNDTNGGGASYLLTNGDTTMNATSGTSTIWTGIAPGTYMCFAVAARVFAAQSTWSPYACTTTWALGSPINVSLTVASSYTIGVTWVDTTGGDAAFTVYDGATMFNLAPGSRTYILPEYRPNTYKCVTVRATQSGQQSAWSPYVCATTDSCPNVEATHPLCTTYGAFQAMNYDDHSTLAPPTSADQDIYNNARGVQRDMGLALHPHASEFLGHYLDGRCDDLDFDSGDAFFGSGNFRSAVTWTFHDRLAMAGSSGTAFDSGWISYVQQDPGHGQPDLGDWEGGSDWAFAVGHGFYRIVGSREADNIWDVHLQLTSYYQFSDSQDFGLIRGADLHRLSQVGLACPYKKVGNTDLRFFTYPDGSVQIVPA